MFNLYNDIKPSDDFYQHVNHNWIQSNSIPDDNMMWNVFYELQNDNFNKVQILITEIKDIKINTIYNQSLQLTNNIPYHEMYKAQEYIKSINDCINIKELRLLVIDLFTLNGITCANSFSISNDYKNSKINILHVDSGGLGLPDKDYYSNPDKTHIVNEYKNFMKTYLSLFNLEFNIDAIYKLEETLAKFTYTNVEKRDCERMNNPYNMCIIKIINPDLADDLTYFFTKINLSKNIINDINITNPVFTKNYYELLNIYNLSTWKEYFIYSFLRKMGKYINFNTENELFKFYNTILSGTKTIKQPQKRSIETLDTALGMLVGKYFVDKYFTEESKNKVLEMITFIKNELSERLSNNTWMDPQTKKYALIKLKKMTSKIGYPDKWRDYTNLLILPENTLCQNIINCFKFNFDYELQYLYKEIDRTQWFMNPHEINAYYSPSYNEIVFPCGILVEPFFSLTQDIACNFGAIGCIIGHEITHGFDDMGRKFDGDGNLNDWWTKSDTEKYIIQSDKLKKLFNELKIEGQKVNGELTLGENIADLGGVEISFNSLKKYYSKYPHTQTPTSYKDFFYNYANIWKYNIRPEEAVKRLITDPHSPACYRVNTILSNVKDFYSVFKIENMTNMWISPDNRASIW